MPSSNNSGFTLAFAIIILGILFAVLFAVVPYSAVGYKKATLTKHMQSALYLAEAGLNQKLYELNQEPSDTSDITLTEPFGTGNGSYEVDYTAGFPATITSTGRYAKRQRKVFIQIRDIAQAFNRHAIYAPEVDIQSQVSGNIYYDNAGFDNFSGTGATSTITGVSAADATVILPSPNMGSYQTIANHIYADGDCTVHPGAHPPAGYIHDDDAYTFTSLPAGIIYIQDVVDDDVGMGGDDDRPSAVLSGVNLNGSIVIEGSLSLTNNCSITRISSDDPALIADTTIIIDATGHNITGLIYSVNTVQIQGGAITGAVVSGNVIHTGGNISYDDTSFKENNIPVYKYFSGGQRSYIPVVDSWKEIE